MKRKFIKSALATIGLILGCSTANAAIINGQFSLIDDAIVGINTEAALFATGSFTTDMFVVGDDSVLLTAFNVTDRTDQLLDASGNQAFTSDLFGNFDLASFPSVTAYLNTDGTVVGFSGLGTNASGSTLNLIAPDSLPTFPLNPLPTFVLDDNNGMSISFNVSGLQQVPEPSALALLGIGVIGFGLSMRRRSTV